MENKVDAAKNLMKKPPLLRVRHKVTEPQRTWSDEILRTIIEGTASVTGDEFTRSLVQNLACALQVRYVLVSLWKTMMRVSVKSRRIANDGFKVIV